MPKLPVVRPKEVIKELKRKGFIIDHISGSHYILYNSDKTLRATVAYHNKPIKRKTLMSILKSSEISIEELKKIT